MIATSLVAGLGGCGSSDSSSSSPASSSTTITVTPPVEPKQQAGAAQSASCEADYRTLSTAIEVYRAEKDAEPVSVQVLVPDLLQEPSTLSTIVVNNGKATIQP